MRKKPKKLSEKTIRNLDNKEPKLQKKKAVPAKKGSK
jgi:hypothetical protein